MFSKKQRFSIRKYTIGAVSVLLGFSTLVTSAPALAQGVSTPTTSVVGESGFRNATAATVERDPNNGKLVDAKQSDPVMSDPMGEQISGQAIPADYQIDPDTDQFTFGIFLPNDLNGILNTNYYIRLSRSRDITNTTVKVTLVDKTTHDEVETVMVSKGAKGLKFTTLNNLSSTHGYTLSHSDTAPYDGRPSTVVDLTYFGNQAGSTTAGIYGEYKYNVVEPGVNNSSVNNAHFIVPHATTQTTYYRVINETNITYANANAKNDGSKYLPDGTETLLGYYRETKNENGKTAFHGENFNASGERAFRGYEIFKRPAAANLKGTLNSINGAGTMLTDNAAEGLKRVKKITKDDGSAVIQMWAWRPDRVDPQYNFATESGKKDLNFDNYVMVFESAEIPPGGRNVTKLVLPNTEGTGDDVRYLFQFRGDDGIDYELPIRTMPNPVSDDVANWAKFEANNWRRKDNQEAVKVNVNGTDKAVVAKLTGGTAFLLTGVGNLSTVATYYYRALPTGEVIVDYETVDGKSLLGGLDATTNNPVATPDEIRDGGVIDTARPAKGELTNVGEPYNTEDKKPERIKLGDKLYKLVGKTSDSDSEQGIVKQGLQKVTYQYEEVTGNVYVRYEVKNGGESLITGTHNGQPIATGNEITADKVQEEIKASLDTPYNTTDHKLETIVKDGKTYRLVKENNGVKTGVGHAQENGVVTEKDQVVTYLYELATGDVTVDYVDQATGFTIKPKQTAVANGEVGSNYDTNTDALKPATITTSDGKTYRLVGHKTDSDAPKGTITPDAKNVVYEYELVKGNVTVEYVKEGTTEKIATDQIAENQSPVGKDYDTTTDTLRPNEIVKDGKTYVLVKRKESSDPASGKVTEDPQTVTYEYKEKIDTPQVAELNFYEVPAGQDSTDDNRKPISGYDMMRVEGNPNEPITFADVQTKIKELEKKGYEVRLDESTNTGNFDSDDNTIQRFNVVVRPKVTPITPDNPGEPNKPIDPNNPDGPTWPEGTDESGTTKTITREVTYWTKDENGDLTQNGDKEENSVKYTRTGTINNVTKEVTWGEWTPVNDQTLEGNPLKVIDGYKPTSALRDNVGIVPNETEKNIETTPASNNVVEKVIYEKTKGNVVVKYIDKKTGNEIKKPNTPVEEQPSGSSYDITTTPDIKPNIIKVDGKTYRITTENDGRTPDSAPENGTVTENTQTVTYVYEEVTGNVVVKYVKEGTSEEIADKKIAENESPIDKAYDTTTDTLRPREIEKDGKRYILVGHKASSDATSGVVTEGEKTVVYEYKEVTAAAELYFFEVPAEQDSTDTNRKSIPGFDTISVDGEPGQPITFANVDAKIQELKNKGYEVLLNEVETPTNFDNDDNTVQKFNIVVRPKVTPITPEDPGKPNQPIDPNTPDGPTWPEGTGADSTSKTMTREVTYWIKNEDGTLTQSGDKSENSVTYTRTGKINHVTKEVTWSEWTPVNDDKTLDGNPLREIDGYRATSATSTLSSPDGSEKELNINPLVTTQDIPTTPEFGNIVEKVVYERVKGDVVVKYVDKKTGKEIKEPNKPVENQGTGTEYNVTTDPNNKPPTIVSDGKTYRIVTENGGLQNGSSPETGKVTEGTTTVVYEYEEVTGNVEVKYVKEGTNEEIADKKIVEENQSLDKPYNTTTEALKPHVIVTADKTVYMLVQRKPDSAEEIGKVTEGTATVVYEYREVPQVADLTFFKVPAGETPSEYNKTKIEGYETLVANGKTDENITFDTLADKILALKNAGYEVVLNQVTGTETFDDVNGNIQHFEVIVRPGIVPITPENPGEPGQPVDPNLPDGPKWPTDKGVEDTNREITRTVSYVKIDENGQESEASATKSNKVTYTRTGKLNTVTGEVVWEEWTPKDSDSVLDGSTLPVVEGYVATSATNNGSDVTPTSTTEDIPTTFESNNVVEKVIYKKMGSWIPLVPGEETPTPNPYPNNPDDPTKPGNPTDPNVPPIPEVPGYVPVNPGTNEPLKPVDPTDPSKGYIPPSIPEDPTVDTEIPYVALGNVVVNYVDKAGNVIKTQVENTPTSLAGTDYSVTEENKPGIIEKDGKKYVMVPELTKGNETGKIVKGTTEITYVYMEVKNWIPQIPGEENPPKLPYPINPTNPLDPVDPNDPNTPDVPAIPEVPGYVPVNPGTNEPLKPVDPTDPSKGYIPPTPNTPEEDTVIPYVALGNVVVNYVDKDGNVIKEKVENTPTTLEGTDYSVTEENKPGIIEKDGKRYALVPQLTQGNETGKVVKGTTEITYVYVEVKNWIPQIPGEENPPKLPYPVNPTDPRDPIDPNDPNTPDVPAIPEVPGYVPVNPDTNEPLKPVDPTDPSKGYVPPKPHTPEEDTVIPYVALGDVVVNYVDKNGNVIKDPIVNTPSTLEGTDYSVTKENKPGIIEKDGKQYVLVPNLTEGNETGKVTKGRTEITYVYMEVKNWIPQIPGEENPPLLPYPVNPEDPTEPVDPNMPGVPAIPHVPGYIPVNPDTNEPLKPVDPSDLTKGYIPPKPHTPEENTLIPYVAVTTVWVDENGNVLKPKENGTLPKGNIPGYEYVTTTVDEYNNVTHVFKKVTTNDRNVPNTSDTDNGSLAGLAALGLLTAVAAAERKRREKKATK